MPAAEVGNAWWIWVIVGFVLLAFELLTPGGFFVLFFGIGALAVGVLVGVDAAGPLWVQGVLFTGISVLSLALFRGKLLARMDPGRRQGAPIDQIVGQIAILIEDLPPGAVGKAELRGSAWSCRSGGGQSLDPWAALRRGAGGWTDAVAAARVSARRWIR